MWLFGGFDGDYFNDLHTFDPLTEKFRLVTDVCGEKPEGRNCHGQVTLGKAIFVFGGYGKH